ncbi:MAG: C10 family peptidase [Bacteroidetes bacterium]|nr:C10 family peptidase [Bacteroidota bacterium]
MKKIILFVVSAFFAGLLVAKPVSKDYALAVAREFFMQYCGKLDSVATLKDYYVVNYLETPTYYVFNFYPGGFVIVSADNATIPILAYSGQGSHYLTNTCPESRDWLDRYSREIYRISSGHEDNNITSGQWEDILNQRFSKSSMDIGPLISANWSQDDWYNYYCPADPAGPSGHALTGCVATAAGMIMKYHGFPMNGIGSHAYQHYLYGLLSADFGATTYDWSNMGNTANSCSYDAVATLLYHVGVSADMNYSPVASGAYEKQLMYSLVDNFNYDQSTIREVFKADYSDNDWKQLLMNDLDHMLPVFYSGSGSDSHAFVCDGYTLSNNMFHFNWGWGGLDNGYYAIGALNPFGNNFSSDNSAIIGIKPGNPAMVARISQPGREAIVAPGSTVDVEASMVIGNAASMELYINDQLTASNSGQSLSYSWNTTGLNLGSYQFKLKAMNEQDTVYHEVTVIISEWIPESSGFTSPSRGIQYLHAVDSLVLWATAYDGANTSNYIHEFTRTINGGDTWIAGSVTNYSGLVPSMIFGIDAQTAYCPMYRQNGSNPQGIFVTHDGGVNWVQQTTALFTDPSSFPNVIHFFNPNEGWCMGDPVNGHFECYSTTDGGDHWVALPENALPPPLAGEYGVTGFISSVGDHIWFGTSKGRVFRSGDRGKTWQVSSTTLLNKYVDVKFADTLHGICMEDNSGSTGNISESFDGGITWSTVIPIGPHFSTSYAYVPGTPDTWISTGAQLGSAGASFSLDGGHHWQLFDGTDGLQYLSTVWLNSHLGWAGAFYIVNSKSGFYKFRGVLQEPTILPPNNLQISKQEKNIHLSWDPPASLLSLQGYSVFRDSQLIGSLSAGTSYYDDLNLPNANYGYCVSANYSTGNSEQICASIDLDYGIGEFSDILPWVYPNPVYDKLLHLVYNSKLADLKILNILGIVAWESGIDKTIREIPINALIPGIYFLELRSSDGIHTIKFAVR